MDAPSLEAFKARLDVALGSLVWWLVTLHIAQGLKLDDHCGPLQPRPFYDSVIIYIIDNMQLFAKHYTVGSWLFCVLQDTRTAKSVKKFNIC